MHVVLLNDTLLPSDPGCTGQRVWQLGQGLIAAGHRVTFITSTRGPSRVETYQGIQVHALHSHYPAWWVAWLGLLNPYTVWPLTRLIKQLKPDVVHAHDVHAHLSYHSLVIARFAEAATVYTAHDVMPFAYRPLTAFINRDRSGECDGWNYRLPFGYNWRQARLRWNPARNLSIRHTMHYYVDACVAVSEALRQALADNDLLRFQTVYNGLDPVLFDVPDAAVAVLRQRYQLDGRRVILFSAQPGPYAGDRQLLAALRLVKAQVPDVALLVLSNSPEYADSLIAKHLDLSGQIVPGGWPEDSELAAAYRLAEAVVTPSVYFEPFPVANLAGMAAGAVPVTTCFGGGREAVLDGETGFVVNPYDTNALADRLIRLLTDKALRCRMARAGRARLDQQFTLAHHTESMLTVYEQAIVKRRSKK